MSKSAHASMRWRSVAHVFNERDKEQRPDDGADAS